MNEGRISRSWRLTRAAWRVVRADRALLTLAALSGLVSVAAIVLLLGLADVFSGQHVSEGRIVIFTLVLLYPATFVSVFLNTAMAAAAAAALDGRHVSVGEALAVPMRRLGPVAGWALISAVVGLVLEQLARRLPFGSIVARLVGLGWSVASLFAVPILAIDGCSATECLRRSARVVKQRWGEGLSGLVMITAWMIIVIVPAIIVFVVLAVAVAGVPALLIGVLALAGLSLLAIVALQVVVRQTFAVALYRYATTGASQGAFDEHDMQAAFRRKRGLLR